jgi:hypothetical protein
MGIAVVLEDSSDPSKSNVQIRDGILGAEPRLVSGPVLEVIIERE